MLDSIHIKNAFCILPDQRTGRLCETEVDLFISNGRIQTIGKTAPPVEPEQVIDARGLHVLPGVVDTQVHFREPGMTQKEDLETGSRAALLGGVTGFFEMPNTKPPTTTRELFNQKLAAAQGRCFTDYAFFIGGAHENINELSELEQMPYCSGVKIFVGSSTGSLLVEDDASIEKILRSGKRRVIFHSEDEMILRQRQNIVNSSKDVRQHHIWRNVESAVSSTVRILNLARKTGRPVHILHVTTSEEMDLLAQAKDIATCEVLPQHLTLSAPECYERLGTLAQQNPPIREKSHQDRLWKAIQDGTVDIIGSDHAPHTLEEKRREYPNTPSGVPGVQTLLPIMLNHVHHGRLSIFRLVELLCEAPRKVFGLNYTGRIEVGAKANLTIVDLKTPRTIENKWIESRCGWTPFDGMKVIGWPIHVILGGKWALRDGEIKHPPMGQPMEFLT
jgi:dihydroorotase